MKFWEIVKLVEELLEKEVKDREENDENKIRENLRKILELVTLKTHREGIEILINKKGEIHRVCIHSNAIIDFDGQSFDIKDIPVSVLKEIFKDVSPKDIKISLF